jgi:hypothetical protein
VIKHSGNWYQPSGSEQVTERYRSVAANADGIGKALIVGRTLT